MLRAFATTQPESTGIDDILLLDKEESHHLARVRRVRQGEPVEVLNGRGTRWRCVYEGLQGNAAALRVVKLKHTPRPGCLVTLAQAIPLGKAMETIVQKASELGIHRIVPLLTANCEVKLDAERAGNKAEKYRAIAIEACKQCGGPWLPEIATPQPLAPFLATESAGFDLRCTAALTPNSSELRHYLSTREHAPKNACWLVGSEGDFTPLEYNAIESQQWLPVTLGPNVLRADTAAVAALSILLYELRIRNVV
ncbi:MAG: RsmE family RNA methyltransferase [Verrucomicrobiota bacterium]|nr:RsmE family RNA methyltransferase [Verrucomicrobiota bacterium]